MLFGIVYLVHLTKFANGSPLRLLSSGKSQNRKKSLDEEKEQNRPKEERNNQFLCRKGKNTFLKVTKALSIP